MNKKVKKLIIAACIAALAWGIYYLLQPGITAKADKIWLDFYDYEITGEDMDVISSATDEMWEEIGEIPTGNVFEKRDSYGKQFSVICRIKIDRKSKGETCKVSADYEVSDEYKDLIFCYRKHPEYPFKVEEDARGYYFVSLTGAACGKTEEELEELVRHITIHLYIQDKNNKIVTKDISFENIEVKVSRLDKQWIKDSGGTIAELFRD